LVIVGVIGVVNVVEDEIVIGVVDQW